MATAVREVQPQSWMRSIRSTKNSYAVQLPLSAIRDGRNIVRFGKLDGGVRMFACELLLRAPGGGA